MSDEVWGAIVAIFGSAIASFFVWLLKTNTKISNMEIKTDSIQKELDKREIPCIEHTKEMTELIRQLGQMGNDIKSINMNITTYQQSIEKLITKYETLEKQVNAHEYAINDLLSKHSVNDQKV